MSEQTDLVTYSSYAALDKIPKYFGIPLLVGIMLMAFGMLGSVGIMMWLDNPLGLLAGVIVVPIGFFIRKICETDDRALTIIGLQLKWMVHKTLSGNKVFFGNTLTLLPAKFGLKQDDIKRSIIETTKRAGTPS
jgi:type IV secretory pathway VirB3-like protein